MAVSSRILGPQLSNPGYVRPYHSQLIALARLLDSCAICTTLWLIVSLRGSEWQSQYTWLMVLSVVLYNFFTEYNEVYSDWRESPLPKKATNIIFAWAAVLTFLIILGFVTKQTEDFSRLAIGSWAILAPATIILWHAGYRFVLGYLSNIGVRTCRVAIVGANPLGERLERSFKSMPWIGYRIAGYYDDRSCSEENRRSNTSQIAVAGNFTDLYEQARKEEIDIVYIALPLCAEKRVEKIINRLADANVTVHFIPDLFVFNLLHSRWTTIQGIPAVSVFETPFTHLNGLTKRLEDIVLGALILIIIAIPMLLIAIGVKLTSPGPVLFKQRRNGIGGEVIDVWKFRTMNVCENGDDVKQAGRNDSRVTRFGSLLRRTSLDELPQFINVLQGNMSIVGPRPHAVVHNEVFRSRIPGYMLRHKVKPGITGLAQINGYRGEINTPELLEKRIENDLEYIRNWTLLLDIKIIFLTIFKGFASERAY